MRRRNQRNLSTREKRDLEIEIGFLAGLVRRAPAYVEALQLLGDALSRSGRHGDALEVDEQVVRLCPADPGAQYNLACSYALTEKPELAYQALNTAIQAGYSDFRWLSRDPDLAGFRKHPLYRKLRDQLRALRTGAR